MKLEPTSERMIEEYCNSSPRSYLIYLFHIVTYDYVRNLIHNREVLDFGCGSGYGTARIADACKQVVGIDISSDAIDYACEKFTADNLQFKLIAPVEESPLPFADQSFDVVLSFQVIEHVADVDRYLGEVARVLRPGGIFIAATPDRASRLLPLQKPWNMYHLHEYTSAELKNALGARFARVTIKRMGGRPDVIAMEIKRTRWLRWVLLPVTLPFVSETIRLAGLRLATKLASLRRRSQHKQPDREQEFGFGPEDITISDHAEPSVNLIALAHR
jgi:SAM-dependent methyltransferase